MVTREETRVQRIKYSIETHVDPDKVVHVNVTAPEFVSTELALVVGSAPAVVAARIELNREARTLEHVASTNLGNGVVEHALREGREGS